MGTKLKFISVFLAVLCHGVLISQVDNQIVPPLNGSNIIPSASRVLQDNDPNIATLYKGDPSYNNVLIFEVDKSAGNTVPFYQTTSWTADLELDIRYYTTATAYQTETKTYNLHFDAGNLDAKNLLKVVENLNPPVSLYKNKIEVVVNSLTITPSSFTQLQNAFNIILKYKRSGTLDPDFRTGFSSSPSVTMNQGVFSLNNLTALFPESDELDVEWMYVDKESSFYTANVNIIVNNGNSSNWNSKFLKFSRVTVFHNAPALKLPAIYNDGYIVYRVRQVYYDELGNRLTGEWIESHNNILNKVAISTNHNGDLNWTSSVSFAEEGKHKDVVTYFDGSQRDRQSVTYDNSSNRPIVAETYYDAEGRKSAAILPAPHLTSSEIKYYPNFNLTDGTLKPYDAKDFSYLPNCDFAPKKLSTTTGASHYYSASNILKNDKYNQFIPDAEGYPLTISEYTNDNTGRIKRQTGVGAEFQFDKGRYTEYLYGKPSSVELDRLFGTDVGKSSHYFKNTVIDPNGQRSITYVDMSGKTIATALEGNTSNEAIVNTSNNQDNVEQMDLDLLHPDDMNINPQLAKNIGSATLLVPHDQVVKFTLNNDKGFFNNENCKESFCSDCYYDIDFTVKDDCGTTINTYNYKNYDQEVLDNNEIDIDCQTFLNPINIEEDISLNSGENYVSLDVTIPPKVIDFYEKRYLESDLCVTSLDELIEKHRLRISPMSCIETCEECMEYYGDEQAYQNRIVDKLVESGVEVTDDIIDMAILEAKNARKRCDFLCNGQDNCELKKSILLADVSPGGQYSLRYYKDDEPPVWGIDDKLHVLHNIVNSDFQKPSGEAWNLPDANASYPAKSGDYPDIDTLIEMWSDEIAEYLVEFHPEYCYYEYCVENNAHINFIDEINRVEKWAEAVEKGYIVDGTSPNSWAMHIANNHDPYFTTGGGSNKIGDFQSRVEQYWVNDKTSFNIFELAVIMTSPELYDQDAKTVDLSIFADVHNGNCSGQKDAAWLMFRNLYLDAAKDLFDKLREDYIKNNGCTSVDDIGICTFNKSLKDISWWMRLALLRKTTNATQEAYCHKTARFQNINTLKEAMKIKLMTGVSTVDDEKAKSKDSLMYFCDTNCINMAEGWMNSLSYCPDLQDKNSLVAKKIKAGLIAICQSSCGETDYPSGASSVSTIDPALVNGKIKIKYGNDSFYAADFQDVIEYYLPNSKIGATNTTNAVCNALYIDYPEKYGVRPHFEPRKLITSVDTCACENLEIEKTLFTLNPKGANSLYEYLNNKYAENKQDFHMSEDHFNILVNSCEDRKCKYLPEEIEMPYIFECYPRISCDEFNAVNDAFRDEYKVDHPTDYLVKESDPHYNKLWVGYLNDTLNINGNVVDYRDFQARCDSCEPRCNIADFIKSSTQGQSGNNLSVSDFTDIAIDYNTAHGTQYTGEQIMIMFFSFRSIDCQELNDFYTNTAIPNGGIYSGGSINAQLKTLLNDYFKTKFDDDVIVFMFEKCDSDEPITDYKCDVPFFSKPHSPDTDFDPEDDKCQKTMEDIAITSALEEYNRLRQESLNDFRNKYIAKCLSSANTSLNALVNKNEFHYTLYYYGQDGNLLATVPPKGVKLINPVNVVTVPQNREMGQSQPATHEMMTTYEYNAANQVVRQFTPDGGMSIFIYDQLGRLILSQNAQQEQDGKASYTLYDALGRIYESGEAEIGVSNSEFIDFKNAHYVKYEDYLSWIKDMKSNVALNYVTRTYYDKVAPVSTTALQLEFDNIQENLRHRISSITLDERDNDKDESTYHSALHYSYDVLGNVKTLVSENKELASSLPSQQFKTIQYEYDLVSGKVNKVKYQENEPDQFEYKYTYDAENRIKNLFSSKDGINYIQEAQYEYYLHGPLARVIYGEDNVQGVDYAYTLQGWLKAINASVLNSEYDMGKDGNITNPSNLNLNTARDAVAMTLRYHQNDYKQIARISDPVESSLPAMGSTGYADNSLYNGNISSSIVSIKDMDPHGYHYTYDQLNRLVGFDVYNQLDVANNDFTNATVTNDYKEQISYDPNGNITAYFRNKDNASSATASNMDELEYFYYHRDKTTGQKTMTPTSNTEPTNQLAQVIDAVTTSNFDLDIESQNPDNYKYDEIGNLIRDEQELMDISWTPTGKISEIFLGKKNKKIVFSYDPMGNRISKTVTDMSGSTPTQTIYYTRDAQGNTLAVYDNHYEGQEIIPCQYDPSAIENYRDGVANQVNTTIDNALSNPARLPQDIDALINQQKAMLDPSDSCMLKAQLYMINQIVIAPDFNSYPLSDPNLLSQIKMDAEMEQQNGTPLSQVIQNMQQQYPGEMPSSISQWVTFFYNTAAYASTNFHTAISAQNYEYIHHINTNYPDSIYWQEQHLYGSSRVGMLMPKLELTNTGTIHDEWIRNYHKGNRNYELTNHLGNVLATIKDEKKQIDFDGNGITDWYEPIVMTAQDYYPFGMTMPGRKYSLSNTYRFGFNGKEDDNETGTQDYGLRIYKPSLGKFLSVDPLASKFPWYSPYHFAGNSPIRNTDLDGAEPQDFMETWDKNTNSANAGSNTFVYTFKDNTTDMYHSVKEIIQKDGSSKYYWAAKMGSNGRGVAGTSHPVGTEHYNAQETVWQGFTPNSSVQAKVDALNNFVDGGFQKMIVGGFAVGAGIVAAPTAGFFGTDMGFAGMTGMKAMASKGIISAGVQYGLRGNVDYADVLGDATLGIGSSAFLGGFVDVKRNGKYFNVNIGGVDKSYSDAVKETMNSMAWGGFSGLGNAGGKLADELGTPAGRVMSEGIGEFISTSGEQVTEKELIGNGK